MAVLFRPQDEAQGGQAVLVGFSPLWGIVQTLVVSILLFVSLTLSVSFCQLLGVLSLNVTSFLVVLFSVVESSGPLILVPHPGMEGRRVPARAKLSCPVDSENLRGRLACPSRLIAGCGDCI